MCATISKCAPRHPYPRKLSFFLKQRRSVLVRFTRTQSSYSRPALFVERLLRVIHIGSLSMGRNPARRLAAALYFSFDLSNGLPYLFWSYANKKVTCACLGDQHRRACNLDAPSSTALSGKCLGQSDRILRAAWLGGLTYCPTKRAADAPTEASTSRFAAQDPRPHRRERPQVLVEEEEEVCKWCLVLFL